MRGAGALLAMAFGFAALVAAQQPPTQTATSSPQTAARGAQSGTITVTGCLQHGDMSATSRTTGTTGGTTTAGTAPSRTTSGSGNGASFILTNASSSGTASTGSTAGTTGTTGATTTRSAASGTTYALEGTTSELSSMNVGKKVEVTGTLDTSSSSTAGTTGTTGAPTTSAPGSMSAHPASKLRVSSVRLVGGDCSSEK